MCLGLSVAVAGELYDEGTVWSVTFVKTEANMGEEYVKDLAGAWKKVMDAAVEEGLIISYKVLWGEAANPDDWNMMLMTEMKNYAAMDDVEDKWRALTEQAIGSEDLQLKMSIDREKIRDIFGSKLMREIHIK